MVLWHGKQNLDLIWARSMKLQCGLAEIKGASRPGRKKNNPLPLVAAEVLHGIKVNNTI